MKDNSEILISIGIATHNHKDYITQAIESVLEQELNFKYEIVICDDASDDGTYELLKNFQSKNPDNIQLFRSESKVGPLKNAEILYSKCKGKYMAWLDGDDFWTCKSKIKTQVEFLELHPDYNACFHDAEIYSTISDNSIENNQAQNQSLGFCKKYSQFNKYRENFYPWDLLERNIIPTASLVFRNGNYLSFFETYKEISISLNWLIQLYLIRNSKFYYFNECWSVYRDHKAGISKTIAHNRFKEINIRIFKKLLKDPYYKKHHKIKIIYGIINEYRQALYNAATYKEERSAVMGLIISYWWNSVRLSVLETKYFFGRFLKKI